MLSTELKSVLGREVQSRDDILDLANFLERRYQGIFKGDRVLQTLVLLRGSDSVRQMHGVVISRKMGMSVRTLSFALAKHNTSLKTLRDQVLKERCLKLMDSGISGATDLTKALGYCDTAQFYRVFKRWTGCGSKQFKESRSH